MRKRMATTAVILGFFFVCYFLGIRFTGMHGTNFHFAWLVLGILLITWGICVKKGILFGAVPVWVKRLTLIAVCMGCLLFAVVQGCIISGFGTKAPEGLDYIIVLGAQMKENGPSRVLKMRLDTAYDYLVENTDTYVIVSGAQGSDEPVSEAQGMYDYLVEKGIAGERIIREDKSRDTNQNINFSSDFLDKEKNSVGIVTNNFHIFRAAHIAKKSGYRHVYGIAAPSERTMLPNNMLREFFGVMKDFLAGNM